MLNLESKIIWEQAEGFDTWLESALVTVSPNREYLFMSGQLHEPVTFIAKLRKEPINQYVLKQLNIALDMNEQVTSLLCLPVMSTQKTAIGGVDWTVFVVGLSSGYVKFYTEQSNCLLSIKFCDEPNLSLKCQTRKINTNARSDIHFATITDEILIVHETCAIVIDGLTLFENLKIAKEDIIKNGLHYEPAYNLTNMPTILTCQKWKYKESSSIIDGELLGIRSTTSFDSLKCQTIDPDDMDPKACARTIAFIGNRPFLSCYRESRDTSSHSYTEMIGSLFSIWNKPTPSNVQMQEVTNSKVQSFPDKDRQSTSIVASPDKRLVAITDDFGRVLLVDVTNWLIIRMWKGYRSAQCGWVEVKKDPDNRDSPYASFLVIYAPKRGLLEVWATQRGPRIAAVNVGKGCRLLYSGYKMLNTRAGKLEKSAQNSATRLVEQSYSSNCYLLNSQSETLSCLDLPYTYSLYKQGDFRSRDKLLIGELKTALEQENVQVCTCSEIIHRMSLSESIETAIELVAVGLSSSEKVVEIMENLINKTMRNYDNHPGEVMTSDDEHAIKLAKRIIKLCVLFNELSKFTPRQLALPELNVRLIDSYEEHPKEVDEFSKALGWSAQEVLRYMSLGALEKSFVRDRNTNPWPEFGEPLVWTEFIRCFDLSSRNHDDDHHKPKAKQSDHESHTKHHHPHASDPGQLIIRLQRLNRDFLGSERVLKTAMFLYNRLSETFYDRTNQSSNSLAHLEAIKRDMQKLMNSYNFIEPSSRLALLFQFWLSTSLCQHWKMWAFIQAQVDLISDELKVHSMNLNGDESSLIFTWKLMYHLILESDNLYAALIATTCLKTVTLRTIQDNEKREKLNRNLKNNEDEAAKDKSIEDKSTKGTLSDQQTSNEKDNNDWETDDWDLLCIDAERMSIVGQQLEDVFLLSLLLQYSFQSSNLVNNHFYRIPRISVASILRAGPSIVSELVAQWVVQSGASLKTIKESYGTSTDAEHQQQDRGAMIMGFSRNTRSSTQDNPQNESMINDEHAKELIHHVRTAFPCSLEPDIILAHCVWELCTRWSSGQANSDRLAYLTKTLECLRLIDYLQVAHKLSTMVYKNFFQFTFERLVSLVQSNSTIVTMKNSRMKDTLIRRELSMSKDCLDGFVGFCLDLSDFMMQSLADLRMKQAEQQLQQPDNMKQACPSARFQSNKSSTSSSPSSQGEGVRCFMSRESSKDDPETRLMYLDHWWHIGSSISACGNPNCDSDGSEQQESCGLSIIHPFKSSLDPSSPSYHQSLMMATIDCSQLFSIEALVELNKLATLMNLIFELKIIKCYPKSIIGEESRQILQLDLKQELPTATTEDMFMMNSHSKASTASSSVSSMTSHQQEARVPLVGAIHELRRKFARKCILSIVSRLDEDLNEFDESEFKGELKLYQSSTNMTDSTSAGITEALSKATLTSTEEDLDKSRQASLDLFTIDRRKTKTKTKTAKTNIVVNNEKGSKTIGDKYNKDKQTNSDDDADLDNHLDYAMGKSGSSVDKSNKNKAYREAMKSFTQLLSLANDWQLDRDELHLEFVFELYRCNHDKLASQLSHQIVDQQTLAEGLLKIPKKNSP